NILANVAAEDAVAELFGEFLGNFALVLDGPVADALVRVEASGSHEGVCGAGVETGGAASAEIAGRSAVAFDADVEDEAAEQKPRSMFAVEHGGVFAAPPESR